MPVFDLYPVATDGVGAGEQMPSGGQPSGILFVRTVETFTVVAARRLWLRHA